MDIKNEAPVTANTVPLAEKAAGIISEALTGADSDQTRTQILDVTNQELGDAHVRVFDLAPHGGERIGTRTGVTREALLHQLELRRSVVLHMGSRAMRRSLG